MKNQNNAFGFYTPSSIAKICLNCTLPSYNCTTYKCERYKNEIQKLKEKSKLKNQERQKNLDKKKWIEGSKRQTDPSGDMPYCKKCVKRVGIMCKATQAEREEKCLCATAFNRIKREK